MELSQSEEKYDKVWVANNLINVLSNLGGYATVLTSFFAVLIGNYQEFTYDKSMLKKLYFKKETES